MEEPANLTEWIPESKNGDGRLFTCGRPGRATYGRKKITIDEQTIDSWVSGLPEADQLQLVSLLGRKPGGFSEFVYYPFRSSEESDDKPSMQEWLDQRYPHRFVVHEFPTVDARAIPGDLLDEVGQTAQGLIQEGFTVVIMDSAGAERTARVCESIGYRRSN